MEKKRITIGTIGHHQHGKTTLMHAIAKYLKSRGEKVEIHGDIGITKEGQELMNDLMDLE